MSEPQEAVHEVEKAPMEEATGAEAPLPPTATTLESSPTAPEGGIKPNESVTSLKGKKSSDSRGSTVGRGTRKGPQGSTRGGTQSNNFIHSKVYGTAPTEITTGAHVNGQFLSTGEENERFRRRNNVKPTYKGPVYVSEDAHTLCELCRTPVDPVTRVPVGTLFFHPFCVQCCLCGKKGVEEPFHQYGYSVICSDCVCKGHTPFVNVEEAERRGLVLGSVKGDPQKLFRAQDEQRRRAHLPPGTVHSRFGQSGVGATVNQTTVEEATPPTLTVTGNLHHPRNTTTRSFQLMQRQQYYTQNDWNVQTVMPASNRGEFSGKGSTTLSSTNNEIEGETPLAIGDGEEGEKTM